MTTYRVEIDALSHSNIWQTMHTERFMVDSTSIELAEDAAQNQNVAEGDNWRVRVYLGDDNDHVAEAGPQSNRSLADLASAIAALAQLPPIERADRAAALAIAAKHVLARVRRAAVFEATRSASWADVAKELGVSTAAVNQLVTQHRTG